jgi:hypothetical protein
LLSAHFTTLELSGRVLKLHTPPFDAVYRKNRSPLKTPSKSATSRAWYEACAMAE